MAPAASVSCPQVGLNDLAGHLGCAFEKATSSPIRLWHREVARRLGSSFLASANAAFLVSSSSTAALSSPCSRWYLTFNAGYPRSDTDLALYCASVSRPFGISCWGGRRARCECWPHRSSGSVRIPASQRWKKRDPSLACSVELLDDANRRVEADRPTGTVVLPGHLRQGGQTTAGRMITHRQKKIVGGWSRHENSVDSVCAD